MTSLQIVEHHSSSKLYDTAHNEDVTVVAPGMRYIAVIDGSSLAKGETYNGMTGGRFAATMVADAIVRLPDNITAHTAIDCISDHLRSALDRADRGPNPPATDGQRLAAAAAVIYARDRNEIWSIGDCPFMIANTAYQTTLKVAEFRAQARQYKLHELIMGGMTEAELLKNDPTPKMIAAHMMQDSRRFANSSDPLFGYGVLNGDRVPHQHVRVFNVGAAKQIVLASDGYPKLRPSLASTEAYLAKVTAEDPLCYRINVQAKGMVDDAGFDDRTYMRIKISRDAPGV